MKDKNAMWKVLAIQHQKEAFHLMILGGDQVYADLELPSIGWQHFALDSSEGDSAAFPQFLDTYTSRLLTEPLSVGRRATP